MEDEITDYDEVARNIYEALEKWDDGKEQVFDAIEKIVTFRTKQLCY